MFRGDTDKDRYTTDWWKIRFVWRPAQRCPSGCFVFFFFFSGYFSFIPKTSYNTSAIMVIAGLLLVASLLESAPQKWEEFCPV